MFIPYNITTWEIQFLEEYYIAYLGLTIIIYCSLIAYNTIYLQLLLKRAIIIASILIMITCFSITLNTMLPTVIKFTSSNFFFLNDSISKITKSITILISTICVIISQEYIIKNKINNTEYELIMIFALLGLMTLVLGNDFNTIFLGLELLGLSLYLLTGIKKNTIYCIEGGLKYFLFSSLFGGFYALGWSLLYGTSGMFILLNFQLFLFIFFSDKKIINKNFINSYNDEYEYNNIDLKELNTNNFNSQQNFTESKSNYSNIINDLIINTEKFELFHFSLLISNGTSICDACDEMARMLLKTNKLDEYKIIKAYEIKNNQIKNIEEYKKIDCKLCKSTIINFLLTDEEKKIIEIDKKEEETNLFNKECWFCKTLRHCFLINLENEIYKNKLIKQKSIEVYTNKLTENEISLKYKKLLHDYYEKRHDKITNKILKEIIKRSIIETCILADQEKIKCPFCHFVIKRFINNHENEVIFDLLIKKLFFACKETNNNSNKTCEILFNFKKVIQQQNDQEKKQELNTLFIFEKHNDAKTITYLSKKNLPTNVFYHDIDFTSPNPFEKIIEASIIIIILGFFFKLALAPFHLWSLDIYEAAPTSSTLFFATATKISIIIVIIKISYSGFYNSLKNYLYQCFTFTAISSVFVGSIGGLAERKLKSLLAYSSISNLGYVIMTLTIGTINSLKTAIFYLIIYISSSLATWSGLISIQKKTNRYAKKQNKDFVDIVLLKKANPIMTILFQIALFSTAGLPPFIGFLTKVNIFLASMESYMYLISFVTIIIGIFSTFYYLRLIKTMCFEKVLVGKLYQTMKPEQSTINSILALFLIYQYIKPWLTILYSYKIIIS